MVLFSIKAIALICSLFSVSQFQKLILTRLQNFSSALLYDHYSSCSQLIIFRICPSMCAYRFTAHPYNYLSLPCYCCFIFWVKFCEIRE